MLIERGQYMHGTMRRVRISQQSLDQQLRSQGVTDVDKVQFAVLESSGTISVMSGDSGAETSTLPRRMG